LRNFYKEDVTKLQKLLKQDTPWNSFN